MALKKTFSELQGQLDPQIDSSERGSEPWDVLVIPSLSLSPEQVALVEGAYHYEERQLFELIRLRQPRARMTFVTSKLLSDLVVDSVLELLPGVPISHARQRLRLFDADDASPKPLATKLLERPRLMDRIRADLRPGRSYISCYNVGPLECQLSETFQLPLLGCDPQLTYWGSKAGSRELFRRCGLPHPDGSERVFNFEELINASLELAARNPHLKRAVIKLNDGFSGEGNAPLDLSGMDLSKTSVHECRQRMRHALEGLQMPAAGWRGQLLEQGALVEEWLEGGDEVTSPSVQGVIHPGGNVEVLSTHEQQLGGASGQTYLGCQFPANAPYRQELQRWGMLIGKELARLGALDHFSVDGLARRFGSTWFLHAIEVNLRKGGTTHPHQVLRYLSNGQMDSATGTYRSPQGSELHYVATDNFTDPRLKGLLPMDLIDAVAEAGLHYDALRERGAVFHLLGCLSEHGKLGMTCIGTTLEEAQEVYRRTRTRLLEID